MKEVKPGLVLEDRKVFKEKSRKTDIGYDFELTSIYIFTEVEKFRILQKVSDSNSSFDN